MRPHTAGCASLDGVRSWEGLRQINRAVKQSMDNYSLPKGLEVTDRRFNLLMTFTRVLLTQEVTPKMTFTFVDGGDCEIVAGEISDTVVSEGGSRFQKRNDIYIYCEMYVRDVWRVEFRFTGSLVSMKRKVC